MDYIKLKIEKASRKQGYAVCLTTDDESVMAFLTHIPTTYDRLVRVAYIIERTTIEAIPHPLVYLTLAYNRSTDRHVIWLSNAQPTPEDVADNYVLCALTLLDKDQFLGTFDCLIEKTM